jgi:hypothetical protein
MVKAALRHYIIGVWLLATPAIVLCGVVGLWVSAMMPIYMTAPLLVALILTIPFIDDRPHYRPALLIGLFLAQVAVAFAVTGLLAGRPTAWRRSVGEVAWFIGLLLPFAIVAIALLGARRDAKHARMAQTFDDGSG